MVQRDHCHGQYSGPGENCWGLGQGGGNKFEKSDSRDIFEVELSGFADNLNMEPLCFTVQ